MDLGRCLFAIPTRNSMRRVLFRLLAIPLLVAPLLAPRPAAGSLLTLRPDGTGDFPTIQAALFAASPGDTILLENGVYRGDGNRDANFYGKTVLFRSVSGEPNACVIDCEASETDLHRAFDMGGPGAMIEGLTIRNGCATTGGAVRSLSGSPVFRNCRFESNRAIDGPGGAVVCVGGSASFVDCVFDENHSGGSLHAAGGAVAAAQTEIEWVRCVFTGNGCSRESWNGGGALHIEDESASLIECEFRENEAPAGGAVVLVSTGTTMSKCAFLRNRAVTGGALYLQTIGVEVEMDECRFGENQAELGGGAIFASCFDGATITRSTFTRNSASAGGALSWNSCAPNTPAVWEECTFIENEASTGGGAIRFQGLGDYSILGCTFASNRATAGASGITSSGCDIQIKGTIIAFGEGPAVDSSVDPPPTLSCSCIFGNQGGDWSGRIAEQAAVRDNLSADPLFCPDTSDPMLRDDSPCAEANNEACGLIGALGVGCTEPPAVEATSWGRIRVAFR